MKELCTRFVEYLIFSPLSPSLSLSLSHYRCNGFWVIQVGRVCLGIKNLIFLKYFLKYFLNYFNVLMSKIIFKKYKKIYFNIF